MEAGTHIPKLYTLDEVAEILRYKTKRSVQLLIQRGKIRPVKINGRSLVEDAELARYIERNRVAEKAGGEQ